VNVLFLTHAFPRFLGDPAGSFILRLAVALVGEGVTTTVVAPHAPGLPERETLDGVVIRRFRYAPERYETLAYTGTMADQVRSSWAARVALAGLLASAAYATERHRRESQPQLLHAHWWFPNGLIAAVISAVRKVPLVTTFHGSDVRLTHATGRVRPLFARVARQSAALTAVSTWLATRAHELAPDAPAPTVAPMPADVELFSPHGPRAPDRLLFVGRLTAQKGLDLLLRALPQVALDVWLDVVGDGPEGEALRRLSASLGLAGRVRWHPSMSQRALVDFYRAATALVVPSIEEGLGLVAVEAQLCETPVVAFDSGGLRDVVAHGETGILATDVGAAAIAAALNELLARPDRGAVLGREGRRRALARFAPQSVASVYAGIYREAIRHSHQRGEG
jgi:glycosyltransferase involved in cell wall biosynthesis